MARRYQHVVTVGVIGKFVRGFPIDMLRYDGLHPHHETDSNLIQFGLADYRTVIQVSRVADVNWAPTVARWESFGWKVLGHHKQAIQ